MKVDSSNLIALGVLLFGIFGIEALRRHYRDNEWKRDSERHSRDSATVSERLKGLERLTRADPRSPKP